MNWRVSGWSAALALSSGSLLVPVAPWFSWRPGRRLRTRSSLAVPGVRPLAKPLAAWALAGCGWKALGRQAARTYSNLQAGCQMDDRAGWLLLLLLYLGEVGRYLPGRRPRLRQFILCHDRYHSSTHRCWSCCCSSSSARSSHVQMAWLHPTTPLTPSLWLPVPFLCAQDRSRRTQDAEERHTTRDRRTLRPSTPPCLRLSFFYLRAGPCAR